MQHTYATCDWPPPPGAFPDGYRAVTVTTLNGPGPDEFTGSTYADWIQSRCKVLKPSYRLGFMGEFKHLLPSVASPARRCEATERPGPPGTASEEARSLPFYPARDELVVLHNDMLVLEEVRCVS